MLTIKGIYGREMYETWYQMTVMLQSGLDISPVITHRFPYREFEEAFAVARSGESGKVILDWTKGRRPVCTAPARRPRETARRDPRGRRVQGRARDHLAAGRARRGRRAGRGAEPLRQQLPRPGRAIPTIVEAAPRGARPLGLRDGVGALHLRHAGAPPRARGAALARSSAPTTRSSTRSCFDANGGLFEALLDDRGRGHLRRAEPRLDHRRDPALQGPAAALRERRHGRAGGAARRRRPTRAAG